MSFVAAAGVAVSAYGAYSASRQASASQRAQQQAMQNASTTLGDFNYSGPGGGGGTYNQNTGTMEMSLGDLEQARRGLTAFGTNSMPTAGNQLPQGVYNAAQSLNSDRNGMIDPGRGQLDAMNNTANNQFNQASQALTQQQNQGFQTGLQNTAFAGAGNQLSSLNQTYDQVYGNTLGNLRTQANEQNTQQFANLNQNLFSTGRMGTSGGALQTQAFAKGLASADAGYQLQAQQQAQMAQQNQLGLAQGMTGIGSGLRSQQEELLNNAFGRFGQSMQMNSDLNNQRFQRSMYDNETRYARGQENLGTQMQLAGLPAQLQGQQLNNSLAALGGQNALNQQGLSNYNASLATAQAAANARLGSGSNMAAIAGSPSFGAAGQQNAAMYGQIGSALIQNSGQISNSLGRAFGGVQSPDAWGALDSALASGQVRG